MGCLNSEQAQPDWHWFGNIHLSGPCNRSCYFCIGQYMMDLDGYNVLNDYPLPGLDKFTNECNRNGVEEINLTGTNTDPLLYKHHELLTEYLREQNPGVKLGIRTNAVSDLEPMKLYDKGSVTICSFDDDVYKAMMGRGTPPDIDKVLAYLPNAKVNIVLGPENNSHDLIKTLWKLADAGVERVNMREPYGQPRVGDPLTFKVPIKETHGMPTYDVDGLEATYWDVHTVHVESVNLYASGRVSTTYPITLGHSDNGEVHEQEYFGNESGRRQEQWVT